MNKENLQEEQTFVKKKKMESNGAMEGGPSIYKHAPNTYID
jgi:hypothetical protein